MTKGDKQKKMYVKLKNRNRIVFSCVNIKCKHFSTEKEGYCCVFCARRNEKHKTYHTKSCEVRKIKINNQ